MNNSHIINTKVKFQSFCSIIWVYSSCSTINNYAAWFQNVKTSYSLWSPSLIICFIQKSCFFFFVFWKEETKANHLHKIWKLVNRYEIELCVLGLLGEWLISERQTSIIIEFKYIKDWYHFLSKTLRQYVNRSFIFI